MFTFFSGCDKTSPKKDSSGTLCYKDKDMTEITKDVDCAALGCCFKNSKCWVPRGKRQSSFKRTYFRGGL